MNKVLLISDDRMLAHHPTGWDPEHPEWTQAVQELLAEQYPERNPEEEFGHPERPERLGAIRDHLAQRNGDGLAWGVPQPADDEALRGVHTAEHVDFVNSLEGRSCWLSIDTTAVSPGSVMAAKLAAGSGVHAVNEVSNGRVKRAFCLVRPPGHHALSDRAMGFCLFNNIAVAAWHARHRLGMRRVMIFDWDLHHGNGTQEIFYRDPDVLFVDTHCQPPFYPGTGLLEETGEGDGAGSTINIPMPAGAGVTSMLAAFDRIISPAAERFRPDLVLVSAGFDAHYLDGVMSMDEHGFGALCERVVALADRLCEGRLVLMLEGGYHTDSLVASADACVSALGENGRFPVEENPSDEGLAAVDEAATYHERHVNEQLDGKAG